MLLYNRFYDTKKTDEKKLPILELNSIIKEVYCACVINSDKGEFFVGCRNKQDQNIVMRIAIKETPIESNSSFACNSRISYISY